MRGKGVDAPNAPPAEAKLHFANTPYGDDSLATKLQLRDARFEALLHELREQSPVPRSRASRMGSRSRAVRPEMIP